MLNVTRSGRYGVETSITKSYTILQIKSNVFFFFFFFFALLPFSLKKGIRAAAHQTFDYLHLQHRHWFHAPSHRDVIVVVVEFIASVQREEWALLEFALRIFIRFDMCFVVFHTGVNLFVVNANRFKIFEVTHSNI